MSGLERIVGKMPSFDEPLVFIDFDDVINVFDQYREADGVEKTEVVIAKGTVRPGGGPIPEDKVMEVAWRPEVADALREMNCVWLTSWKHLTQELLNPVLRFDFGYVDWQYRGFSDSGFYGKLTAVDEVIHEAQCPFAVLDDSFHSMTWGTGMEPVTGDVPNLVIAPEYSEGLTDVHLNELRAFIAENTSR